MKTRRIGGGVIGAAAVCVMLAAAGGAVSAAELGEIRADALYLRAGTVETGGGNGLAALAGQRAGAGRFVIQLDGPMTPERRDALKAAGLQLGEYLPTNAWVARPSGFNEGRAAGVQFVRWSDAFRPEWKLDPTLATQQFSTRERQEIAALGEAQVVVTLFGDATDAEKAGVAGLISGLERGRVIARDAQGGNPLVFAQVRLADLDALAQHDAVMFVEHAPEVTLRNSTNRWIVQSNVAGDFPLYDNGLFGEGQIVGILDSSVDPNHCSFNDSNPFGNLHRKIQAYNGSTGASSHGTHVAGTVVGDSGADNDLRGVAWRGKLTFAQIPSFNETSVNNALSLHHTQGARVHTNSWGNDGTTAYDSMARGFDVFNYNNEDSVVLLAVTNTSTLKNPENAKNLLAVGASQDTPNQANHCSGGVGTTSDGRRKPEIYAPGCGTVSSASGTSCGTRSLTGTSMATPAVAGAAMLVREYYVDGYYPGGFENPSDGFGPSGALVKATLINSAVDMTGIAGFPSNLEGWGRVLADNALFFTGDSRKLVVEDVRNNAGLSTGGASITSVNVNSGSEPLKVTLVWMDPAASAGASFAAVNDLNLEVVSPGGQVFRGNVFSGGVSTTGGTADIRNNVEQVLVNNPAPGSWEIRVNAQAVNVGTQGYALVTTGDVQSGPASLSVIASPVPDLTAPGAAPTVSVTINEGDDALVPNSAFLYYRLDDMSGFTQQALTDLGGGMWQGQLPTLGCGDEPEWYVSAEGVTTGVRTSPPNAPTGTFSTMVGVTQLTELTSEGFNAGLPSGWTASGLWNITSSCAGASCDGGLHAYYGSTGACNYDQGDTTGSLTSPMIDLTGVPSVGSVTLRYCHQLETETSSTYDKAQVYVNGQLVDEPADSASWQTREIDISQFAGEVITVEFRFDTVDGVFNTFFGWAIDGVEVEAETVTCEDTLCEGDVNGDLMVDFTDLNILLNEFGSIDGKYQSDLDGDGNVGFSDLNIVLSAFGDDCTL